MELRDYQVTGIDQVRHLLMEGRKKVLVISPTGSGKTVMFCDILARASAKGSRALVLAHRTELIQQTSEKLLRFGAPHGIIQSGYPRALQHAIQVASVQSLARAPGLLGKVDIVVVDEAHHTTAGNTYGKILSWFPNAPVLGFTATPWRLDGIGLGDLFDSHVVISTPRKLRDERHLVGVVGFEYAPIDTSQAKVSKGDYVAKSLESSAMRIFGEVISEWKQHAGGVRTVLFATTIHHSQTMAAAFVRAGVPAEHLDGETPHGERKAILRRLESGETVLLCNVNVATEGWDLPALECAILCRPTLSTTLALQMVGRILRPSEGKRFARIHDHARVLQAHGHPYAERSWDPESTGKAPRTAVESGVKRGLRCPSCKALLEQFPCAGCGHLPTPRVLEEQKAAERRALTDTPEWNKIRVAAEKQKQDADKWQRLSWETKRRIYDGLKLKIGSRAAASAYRRMSGETEWPPHAWRVEPNYGAPG